jgi:hypothetical protein
VEVFDRNLKALDCFRGSGIGTLKMKSGYDVLNKKKFYDLIFLDPYDDFLDGHETVLSKIFRKQEAHRSFCSFLSGIPLTKKAFSGSAGSPARDICTARSEEETPSSTASTASPFSCSPPSIWTGKHTGISPANSMPSP